MESIHAVTVATVERLSPRMVRIGFRLDEPGAWVTTGGADEFVHVEVGATTADLDGHDSRHYSVSALTPDGFEMEIFLHGDGPGAVWARNAKVGDRTMVSDPKAYYKVPEGSRTRFLLADLTGLPAVARILAEAHASERFRVIVEVGSLDDARELPSDATVEVSWVVGGNGYGASVLKDEMVAHGQDLLDPDAHTYVWVACESVHSRRIRQVLRGEFALAPRSYRVVGYWHANLERAMRVWAEASDETKTQYAALWREDRTDEENWLELEPFLQKMGV